MPARTYGACHHICYFEARFGQKYQPKVRISYFFSSHDGIHRVRIAWESLPLLLFSDPILVQTCDTSDFKLQSVHVTNQQHLPMGLRKGMAILLYYTVNNRQYQAVLIAQESTLGRAKKSENRLWRRVAAPP